MRRWQGLIIVVAILRGNDVLYLETNPEKCESSLRKGLEKHSGCMVGAARAGEVERMLRAVGLREIRVEIEKESRSVSTHLSGTLHQEVTR